MNLFRSAGLAILFLIGWWNLPAQSHQADAAATADSFEVTSLFGLPIVFYSPETRWAGGAAGLLAFRFPGEPGDSRPSQLQLGFAYTQERQVLSYLPFILFWDNERWYSYGELGYYRYTYFFYGLGNVDTDPAGELYDVNFPRLRLHLMRALRPGWYLGAHYWLDVFDIANTAAGGRLADPAQDITGRKGGTISAPGVITLLDHREDLFAPQGGYYLEALFQVSGRWTGSPFPYTRTVVDARAYLPTWEAQDHVLALQAYGEFTTGDPPFNALALLGGNKRMRGYYEGRFRDQHLLLAQAEYRAPLFWRMGAVAFMGIGSVFQRWREIGASTLRVAGGGGLRIRISNQDRINLRLDAAFGSGTSGYYVTVGEAF